MKTNVELLGTLAHVHKQIAAGVTTAEEWGQIAAAPATIYARRATKKLADVETITAGAAK